MLMQADPRRQTAPWNEHMCHHFSRLEMHKHDAQNDRSHRRLPFVNLADAVGHEK